MHTTKLFSILFKRYVTYSLVFSMTFSPLLAYGAPLQVDGGSPTHITTAPNGVPIVNIANPNASGLSHNTFTDYNVNAHGLILNNAMTTSTNTQLSGFIFGNSNLSNSASVILNEVTSSNRTALMGFTEVAGQQADLVIANPNGLTINGAGFINTSNVMLTTGKPNIVNGGLQGLSVTGGDIAVQGSGLDTSRQSSTQIYTQSLQLNAQLHAQDLDIKLGNNAIDYTSKGIVSSQNPVSAPGLLLDSSALGGMYANRISLVGTAQGLGVNLPPEVLASTGEITISNDGQIVLQNMQAAQQIDVQSTGNIVSHGSVYSGTDVMLNAGQNMDISAASLVAGQITLQANGSLNNDNGSIKALANTTITANVIHNNLGSIESGNTLTMHTGSIDLTNSTLYAAQDFLFTLDALNNVSTSSLTSGGNLTITTASNAQNTNQADLLAHGNLTLNFGSGQFTNHSIVSSGGALHLIAGSLANTNNSRIIGGTGTSMLNIAGHVDNSGVIGAQNLDLYSASSTVTNYGIINAGQNLNITSANLNNHQTLFSGNDMNLYVQNILSNKASANIFAMGNMTLAADAQGGKTNRIVNTKSNINALGNIDIDTQGLLNETDIPHTLHVITSAPQQTNLCGKNCKNVITTTTNTLVQTTFPNTDAATRADISAGGNLTINATGGTVTNQYGLMSAGGTVDIIAATINNKAIALPKTTTITTASYINEKYCRGWNFFEICFKGYGNRQVYAGTIVVPTTTVPNYITSTIQGQSVIITGNDLNNGQGQKAQPLGQTGSQPTNDTALTVVNAQAGTGTASTGGANQTNITLPTGNYSLFVTSPNPQSQYLIETNPEFTVYDNFISSDYMMQSLDFSAVQTMKRVGDAFYENQLIRDSIFAQTGRAYLDANYNSDFSQFQHLMDNGLAAQQAFDLVPGIALTQAQIAALVADIVWLEEQTIAGHQVLVPVVYIADVEQYKVQGGAIIAGKDMDLRVATLSNGGTLEAGNSLNVAATDTIQNIGGNITAGGSMSLLAENDIENVSGSIAAENVALTSVAGNIINTRFTQDFDGGNNQQTLVGAAGSIVATDGLSMHAGNAIRIIGSDIQGNQIDLNASQVDILTTVVNASSYIGNADNYVMQRSTNHLGSSIDGNVVNISSTGVVTIAGSSVHADEALAITGTALLMLAVNDTSYEERKTSDEDFWSSSETTTKAGQSSNVGSSITGGNISLTSTSGDITVVGSDVAASGDLALDSAGNIDVRAGFDGTFDETQSKESGWFTGGSIFSKSEDLEGKLTKTAAVASLSGNNVSLDAANDITLKGVDVAAVERLSASAQNITVENAENEVQTYSKHSEMSVGLGDVADMLSDPGSLITMEDGNVSISLGTAEFSSADEKTTTTEVVSSSLTGNNISLTAQSDGEGEGNITITGSDLNGGDSIALDASHDVTIKEAKNTESTSSKTQEGKAELKITVKNEYQQIDNALKAAKQAKDGVENSKKAYDSYKQDLSTQQAKLAKLKADLAAGKIGIEQADIDELSGYIDDMKGDAAFYKANIVAATANLATKTTAVASQMATAAGSSGTYGFSASLELDIDALEKQFNSYKETSVGSNLSASNISIKAGNTATIRGSQLNGDTSIDSTTLNILASKDINTSSDSSEHKNINMSISTSGGSSFSASADSSQSSNSSVTHTNAGISGGNITINTKDKTTIAGANIHAADKLTLNTDSLDVRSVQDTTSSKSSAQGMSMSDSGSGSINGSLSRSSSKETLLTSITGGKVNIDVQKGTAIKGALIAAVDAEGNDNGNLSLTTKTLEVSSLNNTKDNKFMSANISGGGTASVDASADNSHSKTKTLATLGSGNINVADEAHSDTAMLNRDINDNEVDVYDIESHKGIKGSLDTRLLTDKGRAQIAEEVKKSKVGFYDVAKDIITKDSLTILDAFSHQGNKVDFFDGMQDAIRSDKALQKQLADPNLTVEQKNELMTTLASSVAAKLDIKLGDVSTIATDATTNKGEQIKGAYHEGSNDIVINDVNIENTGDAVNTLGHELGHAVGYGEEASQVMGESLQDYADFAMWNNTDGQTVADSNNHNGTKDNQGNTIATTGIATQNFVERRDNDKLDYSIYVYKDIVVGTDGINNHKVIKLNSMEASANGFMDNYGVSVRGKRQYIDKVKPEDLSKYENVLNLENKADFEELRQGTDMTYDNINEKTAIVFENGMGNTLKDAKASQKLIQDDFNNVGLINNKTSGYMGDFLEWSPNYLTTKDVLNAQKLQELSPDTVVITHSAGNEDIYKANEVNALVGATTPYRHISVASPKSATELKKADDSVGATFVKQVNHPHDPVANGWVNGDANYEFKISWDQLTPLGNLEKNHPFDNYYNNNNGVKEEVQKALNNE